MRRALIYGAVLLLALLLIGRVARADHSAAEAKDARADSLFARMLDREHELAEGLHQLGEDFIRMAEDRDSIRKIADRAAQARPEIVERALTLVADRPEAIDAVLALETVYLAETNALRAELLIADSMIAAKDSAIALHHAVNADLRLALTAARSASDEWEHAARPGLLGISMKPSTAFVVGGVLGAAVVAGISIGLAGGFSP